MAEKLRYVSAGVLSLALGIGSCSAASKLLTGSETGLIQGLAALTQTDCLTKIPEDKLGRIDLSDVGNQPAQGSTVESLTDKEFYEYAKAKAEENGLTIVDNQSVVEEIHASETFRDTISALNAYSSNFSFTWQIPEGPDFIHDSPNMFEPFNEDGEIFDQFKEKAVVITDKLSRIPTEVFSLGKLNSVVIVGKNFIDRIPNVQDRSPGIYLNPMNNTAYVEVNTESLPNLDSQFTFAAASAIEIKICGLFGSKSNEILSALIPDDITDLSSWKVNEGISEAIEEELMVLRDKTKIIRNSMSPNANVTFSSMSESEQEIAILWKLRVDQHVPGFANYWDSLTFEYSSPAIEEVIIDTAENPSV